MRSRPLPARYAELLGEEFAKALPPAQLGLGEKEARQAAEKAWEAAVEQVIQFGAMTLALEAADLARDAERAEMDRKNRAEQAAKIEREGRAALEKLFGDLAARVELNSQYRLVGLDGEHLLAVPDHEAEAVTTALQRAGGNAELTSRTARGYALGKAVAAVEGELFAVVNGAGDEALAAVVELVRADAAARREADERDRKRAAQAAAHTRQRDEQRRTYGVELD
jgi:hypothetical protein